MNKLSYIKSAVESVSDIKGLTDDMLLVLPKLFEKQFFEINEIDYSKQLLEVGLLDISSTMVTRSLLTDEIMELAALKYVEAERPTLLLKGSGSVKRAISDDMHAVVELALKHIDDRIEIKSVSEDRSNLFINFAKRMKGLGSIEIKNKPELRIAIRKPSQETVEMFSAIGMTHRAGPSQTYFDMPRTDENVKLLIDTIVLFLN